MTIQKTQDSLHLELSKQLVQNLHYLIKNSGLTKTEIASIAKIPFSTLNNIALGSSTNPKMYTLSSIARVFDLNVAQLIGDQPINSPTISVPVLKWSDINKVKTIENLKYDKSIQSITSSLTTENPLFALEVGMSVSDMYRDNSLIIIEKTDRFINGDTIVVSLNSSDTTIKKIVKDGKDVFLASINHDIPLQKYNKEDTYIFGIIRETRI